MKTILKVAYITFIFLLVPINVVNANADTFEVEIGWTHSGKGMDPAPYTTAYKGMLGDVKIIIVQDNK